MMVDVPIYLLPTALWVTWPQNDPKEYLVLEIWFHLGRSGRYQFGWLITCIWSESRSVAMSSQLTHCLDLNPGRDIDFYTWTVVWCILSVCFFIFIFTWATKRLIKVTEICSSSLNRSLEIFLPGLKPKVLRDDRGILYVAGLLPHSQPCSQLQKRRGSGRMWLGLRWCRRSTHWKLKEMYINL